MPKVLVGEHQIGGDQPLALIAGPCVIESEEHLLVLGEKIRDIAADKNMPFILKSSFDKANRSSVDSYRGPGLHDGLEILSRARDQLGVPVLSDVHETSQVVPVAEVVDILQIPAFLCRQTDLLCQAAATGKPINVKKGQFLAPADLNGAIGKIEQCGHRKILLTERGSSFGYHNLVVDMRSLVAMRATGYPVIFDATHSVQLPGGLGTQSGGERQHVPYLARAAVAVGIHALFLEVHDDPDQAPCDGANMLRLEDLPALLDQVSQIDALVKGKQWMS